jgi:hypothetical protein
MNLAPLTKDIMDRYKKSDNDPRGKLAVVSVNVHKMGTQLKSIL